MKKVLYIPLILLGIPAILITIANPGTQSIDTFTYYFKFAIKPFSGFLLLFSAIYISIVTTYFVTKFVILIIDKTSPLTVKKEALTTIKNSFLKEVRESFSYGILIMLNFAFITILLSQLNALNIHRLIDEIVLKWDFIIFGNYPFIALGNINYPSWIINSIIFSFDVIGGGLLILVAFLFYYNRHLFIELALTFFLSVVIMLPIWYVVPVLSPHDRFIDNVYDLPINDDLSKTLENYKPVPEISQYLTSIRATKEGKLNNVMPTSTFPSSHAAWAIFIMIYTYRLDRRIFYLSLPIAILSIFGTVILAQHYAVDVPMGILIGILAIFTSRKVISCILGICKI
ncbi:phosphatase PAP2 family protein [Patescibacteria group bacterium]